jgi:hypothetical protein
MGFACGGNSRCGEAALEGLSNMERVQELRQLAVRLGRPVSCGDGAADDMVAR